MDELVNRLSRLLSVAFVGLVLAVPGAHAEAAPNIQEQLRSLIAALRSPTGSFLAGDEAMSALDTASAAEFLANAALTNPDNRLLILRTFHAQAANGEIEEAAKTARHLVELLPDDELSKLVMGTVALKQRQYNEVAITLDGMETHSFVGITAAIVKAWALIGENRYDDAQKELDNVADGGIEDFLTYYRALTADVADRRDVALDYAKKAYESDPYDVRFLETYARMLANASRFAEAEKIIATYLGQGLSDPDVLALEKEVKAGKRPGKLAPNAQAGAAEMFNSIGAALARDGTADLAAIYLRTALYLAPDFDLATMRLAQLYSGYGQYDLANGLYDGLPRTSPYKNQAEVGVAENMDAAGNRDAAIEKLHMSVVANPDNLDAVVAYANLLRSSERYKEASDAYSLVIGLVGGDHPQDWRYYYLRGMCYERARQWPLAEKDFQKALELNPGNPQVLNYLGYSWIDQGVHLDQALDMIRKALQADPSDGYVVDSLGWAYYRLGRYEEAVQTLEQAVQLRASDPAINDHLGDAYWRAGRKLEARFQWTIAADIDPQSEIGRQAREKLETGLQPTGEPSNG